MTAEGWAVFISALTISTLRFAPLSPLRFLHLLHKPFSHLQSAVAPIAVKGRTTLCLRHCCCSQKSGSSGLLQAPWPCPREAARAPQAFGGDLSPASHRAATITPVMTQVVCGNGPAASKAADWPSAPATANRLFIQQNLGQGG